MAKILFIYQVPVRENTSGTVQSARRMIQTLLTRGHSLTVLEINSNLPPETIVQTDTREFLHFLMGTCQPVESFIMKAGQLIHSLVKREKIELIYGHFLVYAGYLAAFWGRSLDVPSLVAIRGNDWDRAFHDPKKRGFVESALTWASGCTTVSSYHKLQVQRFFPETRVFFLPNSVKNSARSEVLWSDKSEILIMAGEFKYKKGIDLLLGALPVILPVFSKLQVKLIGQFRADSRSFWSDFRRHHPKLNERVSFLPPLPHDEFLDELEKTRFVVIPSRYDGMPNLLLEAMSCGCLVCASSAGGIKDVVKDGENGFLLPMEELARFDSFLYQSLAISEERMQQLSNNARKTILNDFTLAQEESHLSEIFEQLLGM